MTKEQRRAARAAFAAEFDAGRFDEDDVQRDLGFNKTGNVIFDRLLEPPIEYFFPSVAGSALFFEGGFEAGEIALVNMLLSRDRDPVVIDVGADVGVAAVAWASAQGNARVYAFESNPVALQVLRRNAARVGDKIGVTAEPPDSLDAFVAEYGLPHVSAIRINVDGEESELLDKASLTLERFRPALLVNFSRAVRTGRSPDDTIARLTRIGYKPNAIVDGFVAPSTTFSPAFHSYLFTDPRKRLTLPPYPGPETLLAKTIERADTIVRLELRLASLRHASSDGYGAAGRERDESDRLKSREAKIKELETICDERSRVIGELNFALARERRAVHERAEVGAMQELIDRAAALREICDERQAVIDQIVADSARQRATLDAEIALLRDTCDERAALIERLSQETTDERMLLAGEIATLRAACDERSALIDQLARDLRSADAAIEASRLEAVEREAATGSLQLPSQTAIETIEQVRSEIEALATF